jgi:hypothetical protein
MGRNDMSEAEALTIRRSWRSFAVIAGVVGILLAGTLSLWGYYGTTVFYEMILAGIAFCL